MATAKSQFIKLADVVWSKGPTMAQAAADYRAETALAESRLQTRFERDLDTSGQQYAALKGWESMNNQAQAQVSSKLDAADQARQRALPTHQMTTLADSNTRYKLKMTSLADAFAQSKRG